MSINHPPRSTFRLHASLSVATLLASFLLAAPTLRAQVGNTFTGQGALDDNTTGDFNTADGYDCLGYNTGGSYNVGVGAYTALHNTTGEYNTAVGASALLSNEVGGNNTAIGRAALQKNTTSFNAAFGALALSNSTTGPSNTAGGYGSLYNNVSGSSNTALGVTAMYENFDGRFNTAVGGRSLISNKTGDNNIAIGYDAGSALTTGNNNIDIGAVGKAAESNTIRIGKAGVQHKAFIQGIYGAGVSNGYQVLVNSAGKLGVAIASSARFKEEIKAMEESSAALHALHPVTYRYKAEHDEEQIPQFGLLAEEVEKVNPDLVVHDPEGNVSGVRYEAVNAMLLNEFLKEHRKVEQQASQLAEQEGRIAAQETRIEKLTAAVERLSKSAR